MTTRRKITALFLTLILAAGLPSAACAADTRQPAGFYHVSGTRILDPQGNPAVLKGISLGNGIYSRPSSIEDTVVNTDHDAYSYFELAEMGLDHVRYELNYHMFESDADPAVTLDPATGRYTVDPGKYSSDGFEMIDRDLRWAKAAGIRLILQMKFPQGGYQAGTSVMAPSDDGIGNGGKNLWIDMQADGTPDYNGTAYQLNQARLIALWTEIARRYAGEPAIIGYGLINEPSVPQKETKEATVGQLQDLYQRIADGIRTVDQNHILFVECLISWFNPDSYDGTNWNLMGLPDTQFCISDSNTAYEFHFYEPFDFTHQGADWMPQYTHSNTVYPTQQLYKYETADWSSKATFPAAQSGMPDSDGWVYFVSDPFSQGTGGQGSYNLAQMQVSAGGIGQGSCVWYDDLTVTRIDGGGKTAVLHAYDFSQGLGQFQWGSSWFQSGNGRVDWDEAVGRGGSGGSLRISCSSGTTGKWDNCGSADWFYLEPDCTYRISGWVKNGTGSQYPQGNAISADVWMMDRDYVAHMLDVYMAFGRENHVPQFVGEWGFHYNCYDRGAAQYVQDVAELFEKNGLGSNYHSYHDATFGLYLADEIEFPEQRNDILFRMLQEFYGKAAAEGTSFDAASFSGGTVTAYIRGIRSGQVMAALYDRNGRFLEADIVPVDPPVTATKDGGLRPVVTLGFGQGQPEAGAVIRLFLLEDGSYVPLCASGTVPWETA